jgi:hypothetical protein
MSISPESDKPSPRRRITPEEYRCLAGISFFHQMTIDAFLESGRWVMEAEERDDQETLG